MKSNFKILGLLLVVFVFLSSCKKEEIDSQKSNSTSKGVYANGSTVSNEFSSSSNTNTFTNNGFSNNFSTGLSSNTFTNSNNNSSNAIDPMCIVGTWKSPKTNPESDCPQDYHLKLIFYSSGNGMAFHLDEYLCEIDVMKSFNWSLSEEGKLLISYEDGTVSETNYYCSDNLNIYWNGNNPKTLYRE